MKNILVVSVNWLGDVIFSLPVYQSIKDNYPDARVTAFCVPRVKEVLGLCPHIDEIMVYDEKGKERSFLRRLAFVVKLRKKKFDTVFILRPSFSRACLMWAAGIPQRIGFGKPSASWPLTLAGNMPDPRTTHRSDIYSHLLTVAGLRLADRVSRLLLSAAQKDAARSFLQSRGLPQDGAYVVLNTGGNWDLKQWPAASFALLAQRLVKETKYKIVLPGAPSDRARANDIASSLGRSAIVVAGETDIPLLAAIMSGAAMVISADSGPLHLASALGVATVAIFGPTRPELTGPRGTGRGVVLQKSTGCNRAACYYLECSDNICMKQVSVDDVFSSVLRLHN
jgi:heptosyltransferase-1/heptosyltransferase-2